MIWTLTPNPAIDTTYQVPTLTVRGVHRAAPPRVVAGGKGMNVASVLAQLGVPTTVTGFLGGAAGREFLALLQAMPGADLMTPRFVHTGATTRRTISITDSHGGTIINETGAPVAVQDWDALTEVFNDVRAGDVVAICGSFPPETAPGRLTALIAAIHERGGTVLVDTSGAPLTEAAHAGADVLKPNEAELAAVTGTDDVNAGMAQLLAGGTGLVVCSRGEDGLMAQLAGQEPLTVPALTRTAGNPTGAGDSLVAGLVRGISPDGLAAAKNPDQLRAWLRDGQALAAATVASPIAGRFDADVYARLRA